MRVSTYEIIIPIQNEDKALLMHGLLGTVDIVDANIATLFLRSRSDSAIQEDSMPSNISQALLARGHLTEKSADEERAILTRRAGYFEKKHSQRDTSPKFVFVITYGCNLRCQYCFQNNLYERGQTTPHVMSPHQIEQCFQFIQNTPRHPERTSIEIYGGEPLQAQHYETIRTIVRNSNKLGYTIAATTNGYEINHFSNFLNPEQISDLIVTLDGPSEIHDRRRPALRGLPTYHKILENIQDALGRGVKVGLRVNIDRSNCDYFPYLVQDIDRLGWFNYPKFYMYCATVKSFPNQPHASGLLSDLDLYDLLDEQEKSFPIIKKVADKGRNFLNDLLSGTVFPFSQTRACGAVASSLFFGPEGLIYTCNEAVGRPEYAVGTYDESLKIDNKRISRWHLRRVPNMELCNLCPFVLLCSGGCAYRAFASGDDELAPYCQGFAEAFVRSVQREYRLLPQSKMERR